MEYYSAEKEEAINKKYKKSSLIVLIIGLVLGGGLITFGIIQSKKEPEGSIFGQLIEKASDVAEDGSEKILGDTEEEKAKIKEKEAEIAEKKAQLEEEKSKLTAKRDELLALDPKTASGFPYEFAMSEEDGDAYTLSMIINVLEDEMLYCGQKEYTDSEVVGEYCTLKNEIYKLEEKVNAMKFKTDASESIQKMIPDGIDINMGVKNQVEKSFIKIQSRFFVAPGMLIVFVSVLISAYLWFGARKKALGCGEQPQGKMPEVQEVTEQEKKK